MKPKRPYTKKGTALLKDVHLAFETVERSHGRRIASLEQQVRDLREAMRPTTPASAPVPRRHLKAV
jgi:hypothetical protein